MKAQEIGNWCLTRQQHHDIFMSIRKHSQGGDQKMIDYKGATL
jgi:hypothetical protein